MITPPKRIPLLLRPVLFLAERIVGRELLPARLLAHSPLIALVSGLTEVGIERAAKRLGVRTAGLVRIQSSYVLNCPFCIDMNVAGYLEAGIGRDEVLALRRGAPEEAGSFDANELLLLRYVRDLSAAPLRIEPGLISAMEAAFGADGTLRIAALAVKVNYWARLIQALGIPPLGLMERCDIPGPGA